ncbi:LysR substrate-binding domain-containing protein [Kerstersia gyiorum]|uniref:DNA-binding transcriptional LysR family regulator n=2 Tax=Kerstersia gyiorum TaxID=206506 RepID=A0A4Q7MG75_9BURK|nr:LysR substrate-binding domain-containing protein [Kerstersia gyiorum]MCO7637843.1 LysR substrate-binding domain-containing protein [Pseudomonas sp. S 311-6]MCP1634076.1 DNA-binding transcriptional LysR family regulator [Kerstersia gyiorum]MCP1637263.1 DNA-binding transcriptional LysR family regulator [Kerstersia gyiorum]MCP1671943.1 DNA-binding transcriptional LysR family regulator [Kerstersia gyiorum]MCP1679722.1 DNA-binding transcriptional LysR family regulator [Kerstersia gyiorum]
MKHPTQRLLPATVNLNTFEVIARRGSITAAAQDLGLTQSAVSRQLTDLENFVGAALCLRTPTGLVLTEAGASYLRRIRYLLDELESASIAVATRSVPDTVIRISVPTTFGTLWAMPRLSQFALAHPAIQLDVVTHVGPISVRDSVLDAAIVHCEGPEPGCVGDMLAPLISWPMAAPALCPQAPLAPERMAGLPLLHLTSAPNAWPAYLRQLGQRIEVPAPGAHYSLLTLSITATEAGLGAALLPEYVAGDALRAGRLVRLHDEPFASPRDYFFISTEERAHSPAIQALRQWLTAATTSDAQA